MSTAESTFQAMWATRPPRIPPKSHDEGSLFGVCQGIAARYQVNVYLVRILFLGLFFAGSAGVSLYILGIFLMPKMGRVSAPVDAIRKPKGPLTPEQKSDRATGWITLAVLVNYVLAVAVVLGAATMLASFSGVFIFLVSWWILHQRYPEPPPDLPMPHTGMQFGMAQPYPGTPGGYSQPNGYGTPGHSPAAQPRQAHNPHGTAHPGYTAGTGHSYQPPYASHTASTAQTNSSPGRGRSTYATTGEKRPKNSTWLFTKIAIALSAVAFVGVIVAIVFQIVS